MNQLELDLMTTRENHTDDIQSAYTTHSREKNQDMTVVLHVLGSFGKFVILKKVSRPRGMRYGSC